METQHNSDCAVHNEPAFPAGPCNCGADADIVQATTTPTVAPLLEKIRHELMFQSGLRVCDGAAPGKTWTLDHAALIAEIDAALSES